MPSSTTLVPNPFVGLMPDGGARNTAPTIQRRELIRPLSAVWQDQRSVWCRSGRATTRRCRCRGTSGCRTACTSRSNYTGSRNTQAMAPLNQGEPLYEELTDTHRPHVLRLSGGWNMPDFDGRGTAMRLSAGRLADQHQHLPAQRVDGRHAEQRRSDRRSRHRQPDQRPLVQYLHAHGRRARVRAARATASSRRSGSGRRTRSTRPGPGSRACTAASRCNVDFSFFKTVRARPAA